MRKIEERMVEAIKKGKSFSLRNTRVTAIQRVGALLGGDAVGHQSAVYVHGNLCVVCNWTFHGSLARSHYSLDSVRCTLSGWGTVTTRSRLNAICQGLGGKSRFSQCKGFQLFDDRVIDAHKWVTL